LVTTNDLGQAGAVFNDVTRLLDGGLWQNPPDSNAQVAYLNSITADLHAVLNDVTADLALGAGHRITIGGNAYTLTNNDIAALQVVQTNLNTMIADAPNAIGNSLGNIAAQQSLHNADAAILNAINHDGGLAGQLHQAAYAANTGATDNPFQTINAGSDGAGALAAATQQGASLFQVGTVYNAADAIATGGLNSANLGQFTTDLQAVATGVQNILNNTAELKAIEAGETANAAALTTIHLQTVEAQLNLQLNKFDGLYATNPDVAARSTNDNLLDIIDIVQNDTNLNLNAGSGGMPSHNGGFAEMPGFLTGTVVPFVDNQAQTNFWAQFLAEANVINNELNAVANGTSHIAIASIITQIQNYQQFGASFDASQAGIFGARFDNELLSGTLLTDTNAAVQGLTAIEHGAQGTALAAAKAEIVAAGQGFAADAMDVSGNNRPVGGGTYVGTATTVAGATSIAGEAMGTTNVGAVANGTTGLSSGAMANLAATTPPPTTTMTHTTMTFQPTNHFEHHFF
jgi:hypothetical protein